MQRRQVLKATAALGGGSLVAGAFAQAKEFKIGLLIALSGPAALFGPTQRGRGLLPFPDLPRF